MSVCNTKLWWFLWHDWGNKMLVPVGKRQSRAEKWAVTAQRILPSVTRPCEGHSPMKVIQHLRANTHSTGRWSKVIKDAHGHTSIRCEGEKIHKVAAKYEKKYSKWISAVTLIIVLCFALNKFTWSTQVFAVKPTPVTKLKVEFCPDDVRHSLISHKRTHC